MRHFFDTEFIEYGPDGKNKGTIDLVSIGIVSEDGGEYYAIHDGFDSSRANEWVKANVLTKLEEEITRKSSAQIRKDILEFVGFDKNPEFYAYFCAYDWVVFCWIFGTMSELPEHFPMWCRDIKQIMSQNNITRDQLPSQDEDGHHNALEDALWNKRAFRKIEDIVAKQNIIDKKW